MTTDPGLDLKQVRLDIVRPTLKYVGLWSPVAENLVIGTGLTESRLRFVKQLGRGPAKGVFQMEPFTHNDIWRNFLWGTQLGMKIGNVSRPFTGSHPDAREMVGNLNYAAAMCRAHYRRIRAPLPGYDAREMAEYWKKYYNTYLGAGTVEKALPWFKLALSTDQ